MTQQRQRRFQSLAKKKFLVQREKVDNFLGNLLYLLLNKEVAEENEEKQPQIPLTENILKDLPVETEEEDENEELDFNSLSITPGEKFLGYQ